MRRMQRLLKLKLKISVEDVYRNASNGFAREGQLCFNCCKYIIINPVMSYAIATSKSRIDWRGWQKNECVSIWTFGSQCAVYGCRDGDFRAFYLRRIHPAVWTVITISISLLIERVCAGFLTPNRPTEICKYAVSNLMSRSSLSTRDPYHEVEQSTLTCA